MLKIITDSATDLPRQIVERFDLHVIPTPVVIDGQDYFDGATIHTAEFYDILDDVNRDVKTYHINPDMFEKAFRPYAERGDSVIYLCFSTGIAGTYNAANIALQNVKEDFPDFDLTIVDSRSAAIGFGLIVYKLLLLQEAGADKEKLLRAAEFFIRHVHHVFTVRTLKYLIKGGRLSKWKGTAGELLDMKPVLIVDREGSLQVLKTVRGRKKSLKALTEYVTEHIDRPKQQIMGICHGEDPEALAYTRGLLLDAVQPRELVESVIGCAIGAHTGRGIVGIVFFDEVNEEFEV
ncbi:MAG: DegV family protein [Eubacteriales bacterium]|nr:DegV family protein [Eubacteriales bacterium]